MIPNVISRLCLAVASFGEASRPATPVGSADSPGEIRTHGLLVQSQMLLAAVLRDWFVPVIFGRDPQGMMGSDFRLSTVSLRVTSRGINPDTSVNIMVS